MPDYRVSWGDPRERLYDITVRFLAPRDNPRLVLPSWRPGRYLIQDFVANVREWSPSMTKDGLSSWVVRAKAGEQVSVGYRYYAGVLDAGSSFLDDEEAYFNGSNLFVCVEGLRSEPCALRVAAPEGWEIETQLPRAGDGAFAARDYDHLIDSPVIAAPHFERASFEAGEANFHLIALGLDPAPFAGPLARVAREQIAVFAELPLREYRFLIHAGDRWHGVEHEDSCSMIVRRGAKDFEEHFLSLAAHELFHLWNVKRIVPAVFAPYDYSRATPTRLLWAMEGLTSYYGDLSLARAGVWTPARYLEHLGSEIAAFESSPARAHLSLAQASLDGWLQDPSRPHDRGNAWFSFYQKGEIVGALLDLTMRMRSGRSLDEVMRRLWSDYGRAGKALAEDSVERAVREVAGDWGGEFFARYVDAVDPLPYHEVFAAAGIAFATRPGGAALGARLRSADGALVVDAVLRGGTAMAAGLLPGDELLAVNGLRVRQPDEAARLLTEGHEAEFTLSRAGSVRSQRASVRRDPTVEVSLEIIDPANAVLRGWLERRGNE
jgi:predicted metalloprotease with PDZ domain